MEECGSLLRQTVWLCGVFPNGVLPSWGTYYGGESSQKSSSKCGPKARFGEWEGYYGLRPQAGGCYNTLTL